MRQGGTVVLGRLVGAISRNSHRHHCRARSAQWCAGDLYRLFFIVSWLRSAATNNLIFGIGYAMPADTNNPQV
jgi:hypothetical protein